MSTVRETAKRYGVRLDAASDLDLMRATVLALSPGMAPKLAQYSNDTHYIKSAFDTCVALREGRRVSSATHTDAKPVVRIDAELTRAKAVSANAREVFVQKQRKAWMKPLTNGITRLDANPQARFGVVSDLEIVAASLVSNEARQAYAESQRKAWMQPLANGVTKSPTAWQKPIGGGVDQKWAEAYPAAGRHVEPEPPEDDQEEGGE